MYKNPQFKEQDPAVVMQFIKEHSFAFLCGVDAEHRPVATQVPLFIDERDGKLFLSGHIMRNTDHHKAYMQNPNVLAVFSGAHAYISASWYSNKQQVSTWNYRSVHAKGTLRFLDEQALLDVLKRTTDHYENNPYSGANFEDLPKEYVDKMAKAIVAFEVEVLEMDHVFKLSQNRDEKSYDNIIGKLDEQGGDAKAVGDLMKERKHKVFNS
ncbi:MAG TPA: FMN-binding negative transcriptional regulator [Chitinophagaceae bacterium]|jgi:transcriptional regulator|nr:FMN-binding negative transcriptional regulator [Chitinophagaceae bacterium]